MRIQAEGEYCRNAVDVRDNVVKLLKFSNYQVSFEKETGLSVPRLTDVKKKQSPLVLNKDQSTL